MLEAVAFCICRVVVRLFCFPQKSVPCWGSNTIEFVGGDVGSGDVGRARLGKRGSGDGEFDCPSALALVPGLGLVVRERNNCRLQLFG